LLQFIKGSLIGFKLLTLIKNGVIPEQAKCFQGFDDFFIGAGNIALFVQIVNAQKPPALLRTGL